MSMDSGNTPTQYPRRDQPFLEATEPVSNGAINFYVDYVNPYEHTELYHQSLPPVPPPPPEQKKNMGWLGIALLCLVGFLLVGSVVYIGINGAPWQQAQTTTHSPVPTMISTAAVTPTSRPLPTATPTPGVHTPIITGAKAPYPASQIVGYFYQAGLAPQTTTIDTSWSCCQYYPEGGATYWNDLQTGITMDLATFASLDEAQIDGQNLSNKGFSAYVENYCLLSYGGNPSDLQSYLSIMQQACTYM